MDDDRRGHSSHERAGEPENARRGLSPRRHETNSESVNMPWMGLLIVGLLMGTVLGWLIEDLRLGAASGVAGAFVVGSLLAVFRR